MKTYTMLIITFATVLLSGCGNQAGGRRVTTVTHEHSNEIHLFSDNGDDVDVNIDVSVIIPGEVWLNSDHNAPGAVYAQAEEIAQEAEKQLQPVADNAQLQPIAKTSSFSMIPIALGAACLVMLLLAGGIVITIGNARKVTS